MNKIELCDFFQEQLEFFDVEHKRLNSGFHFQIQKEHNFYPTKRSYYNSQTGKKCHYPEFKNQKEFWIWIDQQSSERLVENAFTSKRILKILGECNTIEEAREHFKKLNNLI